MSFSHVAQKGSLEAYVNDFIRLSCRAQGWTDAQLLGVFLGGLKSDLQDDVLALGPHSLARAIELAHIYDNKQQRCRTSFRPFSPRPSPAISAASSTVAISSPKPHLSSPGRPPLRLSLAEVRERRSRGQCLYCPKKYFPSHTCTTPHFLLLDAAAISEVTPDLILEDTYPALAEPLLAEDVPIAFNALVSPKRTQGRAMRLVGYSDMLPIRVFVDSGADLNFLSPSIARRLGLRTDRSLVEPMAVVNGNICYTHGIAYNFTVNL